jgi:hypothetical protein
MPGGRNDAGRAKLLLSRDWQMTRIAQSGSSGDSPSRQLALPLRCARNATYRADGRTSPEAVYAGGA